MSEKRKSGGKTAKVDLALAKECMDKRLAIGATLANFWGALGVAKSTGSRYESGQRGIPEPVRRMFRVVYLGKQQEQDPLEKYGEDGKRMLVMLEDPEVAEAVLRRLSGKLGGAARPRKPRDGKLVALSGDDENDKE